MNTPRSTKAVTSAPPAETAKEPMQSRTPQKQPSGKSGKTIIDIYHREPNLGTEFRRLCDRLGWSDVSPERPEGPKNVLITSSVTAEGKSTIASVLGLTSAVFLNQKTLVLDGDLRRPSIHRLFNLPLPGGLTDCLMSKVAFDQSIHQTEIDKLQVMTAGSSIGDITELLTPARWSDFVAEASFYFDRIVIDCAPVLPVDDAVILGRAVEGVLMVVRAGKTQREVASRAIEIIQSSRLNLLGVVVNNLDEALPYYYDHKYYSHRYQGRK